MLRDLIFARLGGILPPEEIRRWFEPLEWDYDPAGGHLRVVAPTIFHRKYLAEKYAAHLSELAAEIGRPQLSRLTLESQEKPPAAIVWPELKSAPDPPVAGFIKTDHTFQNFIIKDSNRLAFLALENFADGELRLGIRSIFLVSSGPWGKTHLLDALARRLAEEPGRRFLRVSAADFQAPPEVGRRGLSLIIDDVHLLAGRPEAQQSLAQFLDDLPTGPSGLVCAAPGPPQKLAGLSESLRSRLSGGLVWRIEPPEYDLLMELAGRQARECGQALTPETLSSLIRRAENDPRALRGFMETICFAAERGGLSGDEAARRLYPDVGPGESAKQADLDGILAAVSASFGLKVADLTGHSKLRQAAWPRRVAMYLVKDLTGLTTAKIGEAFGGRDHSTVIYALKKIHQEFKNPTQAQLVANIKRSLIVGD